VEDSDAEAGAGLADSDAEVGTGLEAGTGLGDGIQLQKNVGPRIGFVSAFAF
jgi:hypothetical protein